MDTSSHRRRLYPLLPEGAALVLTSNDILPTNADGEMPFRQNNDLYWLTGIRQEGSFVFLFPSHPDPDKREVLFVKQVSEDFVKWHGRRLSLEEAASVSGIANVQWSETFYDFLRAEAFLIDRFYLQTTEHPRSVNKTQTANDRLIGYIREQYPLHRLERATPLLSSLRRVKSESEMTYIREACRISGLGFERVLRFVRPGVTEKQIEAEMIHEYLQHGGAWAGYEPIVASGADSCILHSIHNSNTCRDGDILLIDAAASYRLYNADLTRTLPVNGRYSSRQRMVYDAVLQVHRSLAAYIRAGRTFREVQDECNRLLMDAYGLLGLKTSGENDKTLPGRYSYHNFGHYLGLDVHDVGNIYEPIPAGAVLTIEPGIYIREEHIGVRIENNYQVTENGCIDLMPEIPIDADEIENRINA